MIHFFNSKIYTPLKNTFLVILGCVLFAVPLIGYAYNGSLMRLSGDDYCYAASLTMYGFWKTQWYSYLHAMPYHGDRYSLTFFSSVSNLLGPYANAVLPGLVLLLWLIGCGLVIFSFAAIAHHGLYKLEALCLSEAFVFLTFYQDPNLAQTLYWRSGMLPYTASLVVITFLLALILRKGLLQRINGWAMGLALGLALIAGGFSETGVSLQAGILIVLAGALVYSYLATKEWKVQLAKITAAAFAGCLVAGVTLAVSPSIHHFLVEPFTIYKVTNSIRLASLASWAFMTQSLKGLPIPNFVTFLTFGIVSILSSLRNPRNQINLRHYFLTGPVCAILTCFFLVALCMLPNELARTLYPDPRVLITARAVLVATVAACGYLVGRGVTYFIQTIPQKRFLQVLSIVVLVPVYFYPLHAVPSILSPTPIYYKWSTLWDQRHRDILAAKRNGIAEVHVMKLKNILPGIGDLSPDPSYWYNRCAAEYYGVQTIIADQPGWNK